MGYDSLYEEQNDMDKYPEQLKQIITPEYDETGDLSTSEEVGIWVERIAQGILEDASRVDTYDDDIMHDAVCGAVDHEWTVRIGTGCFESMLPNDFRRAPQLEAILDAASNDCCLEIDIVPDLLGMASVAAIAYDSLGSLVRNALHRLYEKKEEEEEEENTGNE